MTPPTTKKEIRQEKSQLKSIKPNILEGKSLEAIYAFPPIQWAYVYVSLT